METVCSESKFSSAKILRLRPNNSCQTCNTLAPLGNRTRDPANLVQRSPNWASKDVVKSLTTVVYLK